MGIHVVVVVDELLFSDMSRRRQRVAVSVPFLRSDRDPAGREYPIDAHNSGLDDLQACGGDLARDGASQSTLCSERNNRIVSGVTYSSDWDSSTGACPRSRGDNRGVLCRWLYPTLWGIG